MENTKLMLVPAINKETPEEVNKLIKKAADLGIKKVHLDIMDGKFVPNVRMINPDDIIETRVGISVHFMTYNPFEFFYKWFSHPNFIQGIIHVETINMFSLRTISTTFGFEVPSKMIGIALNPKSPVETLFGYFDRFKHVLVMGNEPGSSGQEFLRCMIGKIHNLNSLGVFSIGADIGVNEDTFQILADTGVHEFCTSSFFWKNPKKAITIFEEMLKTRSR